MDHHEILFPTIIFDPPAPSPDRHRRRRHQHRRVPAYLFRGDWATGSDSDYSLDTDSYSSCSSSDDDGGGSGIYPYHHRSRRRRNRHRHINLPAGLPLDVTTNALVRRRPAALSPAPAPAPRNYGYRRLHYQGGQERRGRRRTRTGGPFRGECGAGRRSPQRNILVRCGRWLFGDSRRCHCGLRCAPATGCCDEERSRSRSRSRTRHREEEYWGPGTQNWAYGPPGRSANWRNTPWSGGGNGGANTYDLAPGGIVEEVEEGGTLPTPAIPADADQTQNHYHLGGNGRRRRSSRRRGIGDYVRDHGVLSLVNRERDRELHRNMVDRQTADRERDRELDRNMMDRETAKQRDQHLLALLGRERERELNGVMVNRDTTKQRDDRLPTLLDRERDRDREGKDIIELLDQELERRRYSYPRTITTSQSKKLKARQQSDSEEDGLRAEMEALRNDFRKLMRSTSRTHHADETGKAKRAVCDVSSMMSRPSGRKSLSADIQFIHGRTRDDEDADENQSTSLSRKIFGDGGTETDQVFQMPLPPDEAAKTS